MDSPRIRARGTERLWILAFLAPFLVLFLGFTLWPLIATGYYSFFDWNGFTAPSYVGGQNYRTIAADPLFWQSVVNTLIFAVGSTVIKLPLSLFAAVLLTRKWLRFKPFFRTVFFAPLILPVAMAGLVFSYLLNPSNGALNAALHDVGLTKKPFDVFSHRWSALLALILVSIWQIFGQYMIYWMAALQNVPDDLYEAAQIDGASGWRQFRHITMPLIRPVALIIALLAFVNSLHVFGLVVTLTGGGPGTSTYVASYFIYRQAFGQMPFKYGYASAAALLFAVLAFVFVSGQGFVARRAERLRREYGV